MVNAKTCPLSIHSVRKLVCNHVLHNFVVLGVMALSEFHSHFMDSLQTITRTCVAKRDTIMKQLLEAKDGGLNHTADSTACNETQNSFKKGEAFSWQKKNNTSKKCLKGFYSIWNQFLTNEWHRMNRCVQYCKCT